MTLEAAPPMDAEPIGKQFTPAVPPSTKEPFTRYATWETDTRQLCDSAVAADVHIQNLYANKRESETLEGLEDALAMLDQYFGVRSHFWDTHGVSTAQANAWVQSAVEDVVTCQNIGDRLGVFRQIVWLRHSTSPLLKRAVARTEKYGTRAQLLHALMRIQVITDEAHRWLLRNRRSESAAFYRVQRRESSDVVVRETGRKVFANVYRIERTDSLPRYLEVVETWRFQDCSTALCVPLSIGCANDCPMCEYGLVYGGDFSPEDILHAIGLNLQNNRGSLVSNDHANLSIYYLGGGDACLYGNLPRLLNEAAERYPGVHQIVSTIGMTQGLGLRRLVEASAAIDHVGLQISLGALDEDTRAVMVGKAKVLPIEECIEALHNFHDSCGRCGRVSLMLMDALYDDVDTIAAACYRLLDPSIVHIALTVLQPNEREISNRRAFANRYAALQTRLERHGYTVSLAASSGHLDDTAACGRSDSFMRSQNQRFTKRRYR